MVCDLSDGAQVVQAVERLRPDVVVHTQAMSDVDRCEREPDLARRMNVEATEYLVKALAGTPAILLYISTDYVFDGASGRPYDETDAPNPISVYGRSKLDGEQAALRLSRAAVIRPSTLFGPARMNFCDAIVQALQAQRRMEAFADQTTSPTYTDDMASAIRGLVVLFSASNRWPVSRIVHLTNAGAATRVAFAHTVADALGCSRSFVQPIRMAEQHRPARRPAYSALTSKELIPLLGTAMRPWQEALRAYLDSRALTKP